MKEAPKVGVGVILMKDGKVLLGKRKKSHGEGCWAHPGGHLEFGETFEECAKREVMEETGLKIKNIRVGAVTNDIFENENKHYVTIHAICDYDSGELENKEPEKCEKWEWFEWDKLPDNVFLTIKNLKKQNFNPF